MSLRKSTRINKYISESGLCSRREADRFVEQGNVWINGRRATTGDQVVPGDRVKVNGQDIEPQEEEDVVLIALNKPVGIVSTTESSEKDNIVDFVKHGTRIFPIGRLDKDSQGLILLTNNGDLVNKVRQQSARERVSGDGQQADHRGVYRRHAKRRADSWSGHQEMPRREAVDVRVFHHPSAGVEPPDPPDV